MKRIGKMKRYIVIISLIILFVFIFFGGCIDDYIEGTGKIQYNDFEGGFYGIVGDDGEKYDPINLPIEFEYDGIRIKYTLKILENQSSIHMWGKVVEIIEIEKL
jgi:hypothetical protein